MPSTTRSRLIFGTILVLTPACLYSFRFTSHAQLALLVAVSVIALAIAVECAIGIAILAAIALLFHCYHCC